MSARQSTRNPGFTLMELMIVVAIVGVLASVAIPSFINYQMTSKRAEAYVNLASLAKTQKAYFAEFNSFVAAAPEPSATTGDSPGPQKRDTQGLTDAFSNVGWTPEGNVFFDYDTIVSGFGGCTTCTTCFTATAYGNLDGDMTMSEFVYFHPDQLGGYCKVGVGMKDPPTDPVTGQTQWDMVVRHPLSDRF
jgi:prepilin-type N-terminal cleavage/methylation domain-containing protein